MSITPVPRPHMFTKAPRMTSDELDIALSNGDIETVDEFEDDWYRFLAENPQLLPTGEKGARCQEIQDQLEAMTLAKQNVESELQNQLDFFGKSKDQLEVNFQKAMAAEATNQQQVQKLLNQQIDNVAVASHYLSLNVPWEHLLDNLEQAAKELNETTTRAHNAMPHQVMSPNGSKSMKPSARAMALVNQEGADDNAVNSKHVTMQAYRIDSALLNAQVKVLQREMERYDKTTESIEFLGKFLTEQNIWGLLTKSNATSTVSAGTTATHAASTSRNTQAASTSRNTQVTSTTRRLEP